MSIKLRKIDKICEFIADGVKKIMNITKNNNALKELLRNDHHFTSNPNAVFKTLKIVHDRSGQRGLTQRKVSGTNVAYRAIHDRRLEPSIMFKPPHGRSINMHPLPK